MVTVKDVYDFLDLTAPVRYQMDFDNSGFLVGAFSAAVNRILVALDITDDVIAEAESLGADLIVSHHPMIFHAVKQVRTDDLTGRKILRMAKNNMAAICMHTNLDIASGGVNDALMQALGAETDGLLEPTGTDENGEPLGCGRIGRLREPMELQHFLAFAARQLHVTGIRYCDGGKKVNRIAVCGGSGGSLLELAYEADCDTLVTADVKYDRFLAARELGVNLLDADHFCTENVIIPVLADLLKKQFPQISVSVSERLRQTAQIFVP